jgi:tetratricopeptide (TPR) repeat protein
MAYSAREILEMGEIAPAASFAQEPARLARPHSDVRERIAAEAIEAGRRATELAPEQADAHYALARVYYARDRNAEALACAEAGVAADAKHGWSALLRADILCDLQRWEEAIRAYNAVPLDYFKGPIAWRIDWLKESRAWCKLHQGDREGALADFLAILSRYEAHPGLAHTVNPTHLVDAAAGPLRQELHGRTLALVQQLGLKGYTSKLDGETVPPEEAKAPSP